MKLTLEIKLQLCKPSWRSFLHGKETLFGSLSYFTGLMQMKWCFIEPWKMKPNDLMGPWMTRLHDDFD